VQKKKKKVKARKILLFFIILQSRKREGETQMNEMEKRRENNKTAPESPKGTPSNVALAQVFSRRRLLNKTLNL